MITLKASELRLADTVELFDGGYGTATVKNINEKGEITFFRPYVATADFSYTGGVICTIGIEEVVYQGYDTKMFKVWDRRSLK